MDATCIVRGRPRAQSFRYDVLPLSWAMTGAIFGVAAIVAGAETWHRIERDRAAAGEGAGGGERRCVQAGARGGSPEIRFKLIEIPRGFSTSRPRRRIAANSRRHEPASPPAAQPPGAAACPRPSAASWPP